jgi:alkylhydroperoxidase family enzyme
MEVTMSWIAPGNDRQTLMNQLPGIGDRFQALYASFWKLPQLPATTLELCRLRIAQLHNSDLDWQMQEAEVSPAQRAELRRWPDSPHFSAAEHACLALTEVHAMDAGAITDEQADAVKQHFGEVGLVALLQALGVFDGMIRLGLLWGVTGTAGESH